jgi:hypothetical protein
VYSKPQLENVMIQKFFVLALLSLFVGTSALAEVLYTKVGYQTHGTTILAYIGANAGDTVEFNVTCNYGGYNVPCLVVYPLIKYLGSQPIASLGSFTLVDSGNGFQKFSYTVPVPGQYNFYGFPTGFGTNWSVGASIVAREVWDPIKDKTKWGIPVDQIEKYNKTNIEKFGGSY